MTKRITFFKDKTNKIIGIREERSPAMVRHSVVCPGASWSIGRGADKLEANKRLLEHYSKFSMNLTRKVMQIVNRLDWQMERDAKAKQRRKVG